MRYLFPRHSTVVSCFRRFFPLLALAGLVLGGPEVKANILSWSGGTSGNWSESGNWGFAGVPANGDTLIFPGGKPNLANTNNVAGLSVLNQIVFAGAGGSYNIWGGGFTLSNGIQATNTSGGNSLNNNIVMAISQTVNVLSAGVSVNLGGTLSGAGGLTKTGAGTLSLSGSVNNAYTGVTLVTDGLLNLSKANAYAIGGSQLTIGDGIGGTDSAMVASYGSSEIVANVTILSDGYLYLNNNYDTLGPAVTLSGNASIDSGATGLIQLSDGATITAVSGNPYIWNRLAVGPGSCTWTQNFGATLSLYCNVSGAGAITKSGTGNLYLANSNSFSGPLVINQGTVSVLDSWGLGATNGPTTVNDPAELIIYNNINVPGEPLVLNSANSSPGALYVQGGSNSWTGDFTLGAAVTATVASGSYLNLIGPMHGSGSLTEFGPGTLQFSGTSGNSYAGSTTVNNGTLLLAKTGGTGLALTGPLVIGDGASGATVRCANNYQFWSYGKPVTINRYSLLDLAGNLDAIGTLTLQGGQLATGAGTIQFNGTISVLPSASLSTISGQVFLAGSVAINNTSHLDSPDLRITASVSGSSAITLTKSGSGEVSLAAANSFAGPVTVAGGSLWLENSAALGNTTTPATVNSGASLVLYGNVAVGSKQLVLSGSGWYNNLGALWSTSGNSSWAGNVTLVAGTTIDVYGGSDVLTLSGAISGAGGLTKIGLGALQLFGSSGNSYAGNTYIQDGTCLLDKSSGAAIAGGTLTIGDLAGSGAVLRDINVGANIGSGVPVRINNTSVLDLNGFSETLGPLTLDGATIQTGAGLLTMSGDLVSTNSHPNTSSTISGNLSLGAATRVFSTAGPLDVTAAISGSGGLTKTALNPLTLEGSNSYAGLTLVQQGILSVRNPAGLGSAASGTVISNGASLDLYPQFGTGPLAITNESLVLNGAGWSSTYPALVADSLNATCIWSGPITLNADTAVEAWDTRSLLRIIGPISGAGGLTQMGSGTVSLEGSTANTYAGTTTVSSGTMLLGKTIADSAIPHNLNISGTVKLTVNSQIADASDVTLQGAGSLQLNGYNEWIDGLSGAGNLDLGSGYLVIGANNGSSTFDGVTVGAGTLYKYGPSSVITLTGPNAYTGVTYIDYGTLLINGYQPQSTAYVALSGTLGGSGTVGNILLPSGSGAVAPGPGILTCSNLTFTSVANSYRVDLKGPAPGTGYDQLNVRGTNNLGNATLVVNPAFTSPAKIGQQFVIINNDGPGPITGTFSGLPEGASVSAGGYLFQISYAGGSGNDVVLTLVEAPAGPAATAITTGNGNHALDPNECNLLDIIITNKSGTPMTGVAAVLSASTADVMISQPYATYADVPAHSQRTNATSFQIATLPNFACGADINLELAITSATHGSFILPVVMHTGEPGSSPVRYDNNSVTNVPDTGTIESTNTVLSWSGGPVTKVAVSLWLGAPIASDLSLTLIAPDGTAIDLSSGNGAGANFGSGSADASRTTFDDAAATAITAGTPPFVGAYRPEAGLAALSRTMPVGNWRLRIQDAGFYGAPDTLRAWSLFLYGTACASGGGYCDACLAPISGMLTAGGAQQVNRWIRNGIVGSCGSPKAWLGFGSLGNFHYEAYTFTNTTGADACVTVELASSSDVMAAAYLDTFNPADITANYLGDAGDSTASRGGVTAFSFTAPVGARFQVVVNEAVANAGNQPYTLLLSGLPCPAPVLLAQPAPGNQVRISWPTWAGSYHLEGKPWLNATNWVPHATEPVVAAGAYSVTNHSTPGWFYRLHKP